MEPEPQFREEALNELLKKLRVAQEDILQTARSDSFEAYIRRVESDPTSEARRGDYRDAFEFLKGAVALEERPLLEGLKSRLPLFAEMKKFFPAEDPKHAALDYASFVGSRIGEIPEDRFFLAHSADAARTEEAARRNIELTGLLIRLVLDAPDEELKSLAVRTLLGGASYLHMEEKGLDDHESGEKNGEDEIYAAAERYEVPVPVVDRALRLTESLARMTAERRRKKKSN